MSSHKEKLPGFNTIIQRAINPGLPGTNYLVARLRQSLAFVPAYLGQDKKRLSEFKSKAHFVKVDVDEVPDVAQELGIRAMPTFIFYEKGERTNHITGANPAALEIAIKSAIEMPKS
ncbi:Thioredoxin [Erysiphe neolycopersici]|uniref:Thioredoxin n=1 Tax=Erysiphe neolycopersici TaxID=212602 RepID=A0A420I8F8_9PEZI|nr:Thioredoxin [Erysiphe neolycopersici]